MKKKFKRCLYGECCKTIHFIISIIISAFIIGFMKICHIPLGKLYSLINDSTISLSAAIAGFVFVGLTIFISLDGNKKMKTIKSIGKDNIIYNILLTSIIFFIISLIFMLIDINILSFENIEVILVQKISKILVEIISIYTFLLGFIFFFSSLQLMYWILK